MKNLDVKRYLNIFISRKTMQDEGATNPSEQIKKFTRDFVEKLQRFPLDEEIVLKGRSFFDSKGDLIIKIPTEINE